ncbi:hypothetical protein VNO80_08785 [Phaseolus coccineus]|uniref:DUF4005 domain-containing protein n=1 Tax=Phaseolus coccineus TaxID=3886 RepID=A0AAN9NBC9_PHACN
MGKASKWFRGLLGFKRQDSPSTTAPKPPKEKRRWSLVKSYREKDHSAVDHHAPPTSGGHSSGHVESADPNLASLTAVTVVGGVSREEWAAVKIQAAFRGSLLLTRIEVRPASPSPSFSSLRVALFTINVILLFTLFTHAEQRKIVEGFNQVLDCEIDLKTQVHYFFVLSGKGMILGLCLGFVGTDANVKGAPPPCNARKALGALKGLVKLQALVRGEIERKRTSEWLQRVQTLLRVQAQFRAGRAQILHGPYWNANSSPPLLHGPAKPDKFESPIKSENMKYDQSPSSLKRNSSKSRMQINVSQEKPWHQRRSWSRGCSLDEERCLRMQENDSVKPQMTTSKGRNQFYSPSHALVCEVQSYSPLKTKEEVEENSWCDADNSPRTLSASSRNGGSKRSPFTPTKSDGSKSHVSGYSEPEYPSYMAYTESSMAKVRSVSAPKQRPQYERSSSSSNWYSVHDHGFGDSKLATQRLAALHANFTNKAYPGSGRLDKLGLPVPYYKYSHM